MANATLDPRQEEDQRRENQNLPPSEEGRRHLSGEEAGGGPKTSDDKEPSSLSDLDVRKSPYDQQGNLPETATDQQPSQKSPWRPWNRGQKTDPDTPKQDLKDREGAAGGTGGAVPKAERSLYKPDSKATPENSGLQRLTGLFNTRRRKIIGLGAGLAGGGIISLILFLLPGLRLESYLASINQRVFAATETAVENRMEHLVERYMIAHILNLERCGNNKTIGCKADYSKMGLAGSLFNTWRDVKMEQKIIDRFGLTFESNKSGVRFTIKSTTTGKTLKLTEGHLKKGQFFGGDREMGREANKFLRENTKWHQVLQRKSVRKYLARKHDVKFWCFFACKTRDNIDSKVRDAKTRLKYRMVERVIYPFSTKLGFILDCAINLNSAKCSAEALRERGIDRTQLTDEDIDALQKEVKDLQAKGNLRVSRVLIEKLMVKMLGQTTGKTVTSAVPVAGQVYLALLLLDTFNEMDRCIANDCLSKYAADLNSRQYLEYYVAMRSAGDELKSGNLAADEVGAITDEFQGDHPAEESRVYQAYNNPDRSLASLFTNKAYAAEVTPYVCGDGEPVPADELVCPEKKVARKFKIEEIRNNTYVNGIAEMFNSYDRCYGIPIKGKCGGVNPRDLVHPLLGAINSFIGAVAGPIFSAGYQALKIFAGGLVDLMEKSLGAFIQLMLEKLFPLPMQLDSFGREKYDALEAGGETAASEFNKGGYTQDGLAYGLGGQKLNSQQQAAVWQEYIAQQNYNYQHDSYLARLTSLEYPNSLANRLVRAMPASPNQIPQRLLASFPKMFSNLFNFSQPVYAGGPLLAESPFGITPNGYTVDDPAFIRDPSELTEDFCKQAKENWQKSMKEDELTGIDEYYVTNPCLLEQVVVETGASALTGNDSLDDGIEPNSSSTDISSIGSSGQIASGSTQELAKKILSYRGNKYSCDNPGDCSDLEYTAAGRSLSGIGTCRVEAIDTKVLQILLTLIEEHDLSVGTYALCSNHPSNIPRTRHIYGQAVDISSLNGTAINSSSATDDTLRVMQWLNTLIGTPLAPDQALNQGAGGYSEKLDNLSMNNHESSPKFTSQQVGGHMDHIHVGY